MDEVSHGTYTFTVPKPLTLCLLLVDLIAYVISTLHHLSLCPSFEPVHYPWQYHLFIFITNPESYGNDPPPPPSILLSIFDVKSRLSAVEFAKISATGKDEEDDEGNVSCAVCLSEFEGEEEVREMGNCRHVFHTECIDEWIKRGKLTCPLCRSQLLPEKREGGRGFASC